MKKLLLLAVLLAPCVPSLMVGIESQHQTDVENRDRMLNERFQKWCDANGYDYYGMSENESEVIWLDVWAETDDYVDALDSIDSVLSLRTLILNNP